jgi:hypothetical protein
LRIKKSLVLPAAAKWEEREVNSESVKGRALMPQDGRLTDRCRAGLIATVPRRRKSYRIPPGEYVRMMREAEGHRSRI